MEWQSDRLFLLLNQNLTEIITVYAVSVFSSYTTMNKQKKKISSLDTGVSYEPTTTLSWMQSAVF